ncbi:MAG: N-6 DNA methylase [Lachnospiraceae bacterium]|nr:N-6 DNA methylase [Lachnospiraceae bacterium]
MTDTERREAARQFYHKWLGKGKEDEDDRSYWLDILQRILGADDATDRCEFQKKVIVDGNTKKIDAYIPETKVIIEQKSLGINLDKKIHQSGGIELTPYEQAKRYNDNLPSSEKARWIVTSNFSDIWIYDMDTRVPEENITKLSIAELQDKYSMLGFLLSKEVKKITEEMEISLKAGELVGKIYDRFFEQYNDPTSKESQNSLNILCVRLVFCLYAEDAGLFGEKDAFSKYISQYEPKDIRRALLDLFKVLDTPLEQREEMYLDDELAAFPYVNGGLFAKENIEIPKITDEIKQAITESSHFDWSKISPTIFGAVFESTLNPETRRSGGMHYTSIENIHKVIDPLFLDDLRKEFEEARAVQVKRTKENKLRALQEKMAGLKFLDPACGSGNFLTETYISLRRIENEILGELFGGQITLGYKGISPIKIHISQFYGIEINDFAVTVAKTALWIAESQMMKETEDILLMDLTFLPLKTNANIVEGNALRLDWEKVVNKSELSYIMGNPPFVGARWMSKEQKEDIVSVFGSKWKNAGNLDYVSCWYKKSVDYIKDTTIHCALVSTNSITQGEAVPNLWKPLFLDGVHIDFAYRTFIWDSEATIIAHVHCVIIGFSVSTSRKPKVIFDGTEKRNATNISPYLIDADNIFVEERNKPLCDAPVIGIGNKPIDGGNYLFSFAEMQEFISKEPLSKQYFRPWYGAKEFINRMPRYCLWLGDCSPSELRRMPLCLKRVEAVREYRLNSPSPGTRKIADKPTRFHVENMPKGKYIVIPQVSSERRRYIPIGYMNDGVLCSDKVRIMTNGTLYHFGIITSNVHMSWMRTICCRLKSDYSYTVNDVYNTFPWPNPTDEQRSKIEKTAQAILDARALYPDSSLADLYDPLTMPPELRRAHQENDKAVMQAYGFDVKNTSEAECVAKLMQMYKTLTEQ